MVKIIKGSSKLGWRIRDEYLFRMKNNRKGGFYKVKDAISRWSNKKLIRYYNRVKGDS